jgi:arylsulfatase A-like enzyme
VARPGAPNLLLIVLDDVRIDELSLYGYARETTPYLSRLSRRAVKYDQARASAPWTLPSHASMLTGRWPHELSVTVDRPLDATYPTLATFLADRGYATAGFVANTYYCNSWYGLDRGFSRYEDFYDNRVVSVLETVRSSTLGQRLVTRAGFETETPGAKGSRKTAAMINRDALGWLDRKGDRPFFAFLNYYDAHAPFQPPDGFTRRFGLGARPQAYRESLLREFSRICGGKSFRKDAAAVVDEATVLLRDSYDGCIAYLDEQIGHLFDELERRGLLENTLVIVTSDHGEHFNDHHLFGHGNSLYDSLIRVPMLVFPPSGGPTGRTVHAPVSLRNIPATMVDLAGLGKDSPFPGQSLARFWGTESETLAGDSPVLAEVEHQKRWTPTPSIPASMGPLQAVVSDQRVFIHNSDGRDELYDYERDPGEFQNLAGAPEVSSLLERLRGELTRHLRK